MQDAGMSCDFVGHPVVQDLIATPQEVAEFKLHFGLGSGPMLVCLPGSRRSEIKRLTPIFKDALEKIKHSYPDMNIVLPAAPSVAEFCAKRGLPMEA